MSVTARGSGLPRTVSINDSRRRARQARFPGLNYRLMFINSCSSASAVVMVLAFAW